MNNRIQRDCLRKLRLAVSGIDVYICIWRDAAGVLVFFFHFLHPLVQIKVLIRVLHNQEDS